MSTLVDPTEIEAIVGAQRHEAQHLARAVSREQKVYVLHSQRCLEDGIDLLDCPYSRALDRGILPANWEGYEDRPVVVTIIRGRLFPLIPQWLEAKS